MPSGARGLIFLLKYSMWMGFYSTICFCSHLMRYRNPPSEQAMHAFDGSGRHSNEMIAKIQ